MRHSLPILALFAAAIMTLAGCAHKKKITPAQEPIREAEKPVAVEQPAEAEQPVADPLPQAEVTDVAEIAEVTEAAEPIPVQTLYIPNMTITVMAQGKQMSTPAVLSWQRGVGAVLSIRPVIFEMMRVELNGESLTVIDKMNTQFFRMSYAEMEMMGVHVTLDKFDAWIDEHIIARLDEPQIILQVSQAQVNGQARINTAYVQKDEAVNLRPTNTANYRQATLEQLVKGLNP